MGNVRSVLWGLRGGGKDDGAASPSSSQALAGYRPCMIQIDCNDE